MAYGEYRLPNTLKKFAEAAQTPEDRAAIAVKELEFLTIVGLEDMEVVRKYFEDAEALVEAVESAKERDYLRRILLEAAQTAFLRPDKVAALDELLARIEDGDERQNALYSRLLKLAQLLRLAEDYATARASLMERVEEIEDLRQYEEIVARAYATDRYLDRVDEEREPLATPAGRLLQYDKELVLLAYMGDWSANVEALEEALPETLRVLDDVEKTLDSGVQTIDGETEELDEDELEGLRKEAASFVIYSPKILDVLPRLYEYAKRRDAFDAVLGAIENLSVGLTTSAETPFFPQNADHYAVELYDAAILATKLAGKNPSRLVRLVKTLMPNLRSMQDVDLVPVEDDSDMFSEEERSGAFDKSNSSFASFLFRLERRAYDAASESDSGVERVECYAALLDERIRADLKPIAGLFAEKLMTELDELRPTPTRLYHKKRFLKLLLETCSRDEVARLVDSEDDPEFKRTIGAKLAAFDWFKRGERGTFAMLDDFDVDLTKVAPIVAADEFLDYARFVNYLPSLRQFLLTGDKK